MTNKKIYYNIYSEFYDINKYRELKSMIHHGTNRLEHINRVAKMSFYLSKYLRLDYVSCTRGAMMHDFFTNNDLDRNEIKYKKFLNKHPNIALDNSMKYFDVNDIEKDIILTHMFPVVKGKPNYKESKVVCLSDKVVSIYEFFKFRFKLSLYITSIMFIRMVG